MKGADMKTKPALNIYGPLPVVHPLYPVEVNLTAMRRYSHLFAMGFYDADARVHYWNDVNHEVGEDDTPIQKSDGRANLESQVKARILWTTDSSKAALFLNRTQAMEAFALRAQPFMDQYPTLMEHSVCNAFKVFGLSIKSRP